MRKHGSSKYTGGIQHNMEPTQNKSTSSCITIENKTQSFLHQTRSKLLVNMELAGWTCLVGTWSSIAQLLSFFTVSQIRLSPTAHG